MRSLALLLFLIYLPASASLPSRILPEVPREIIRVSLGRHPVAQVRGQDLRISGTSVGAGTLELPVVCNSAEKETPIYVAGVGKLASPAVIESPAGFVWFNNHSYRATLSVYAEGNSCLVVNTLEMDHYLAGVLNKEMSPSWPIEALKAQAIASRTYATFQKNHARSPYYDLENSTVDQVYEGADVETVQSHAAVQATKGMMLTFQQEPIKAFYHANCGGHTETPQAVWGTKFSYFRPVSCPYHSKQDSKTEWNYSLSREKLEQQLRSSTSLPKNFLRIASVQVGPGSANLRRQNVKLVDRGGTQVVIPANHFRNALGNTRVKSTAFTLHNHGDHVAIAGQGYGHGVGLCQIGAREMAKAGKSFRQILSFYYPLAKLGQFQYSLEANVKALGAKKN